MDIERLKNDAKLVLCRKYYYGGYKEFPFFLMSRIKVCLQETNKNSFVTFFDCVEILILWVE